MFVLIKKCHLLTSVYVLFKIIAYSNGIVRPIIILGEIFLKKRICIIISIILSILLCMCLFYNLVAGAPVEYEAAIRYMISAAGFSIIVSGLSGYSIFRIFSFQVAEDEDIEETGKVLDKSYQGSFTELVSAFEKGELSDDEINSLRSFLDSIDDSKPEE